jgi:hypothetical protein
VTPRRLAFNANDPGGDPLIAYHRPMAGQPSLEIALAQLAYA